MKCACCNREMDKAAAWVGGMPIGPKCWANMGDKPHQARSHVVRSEQDDLFGDDDEPESQNVADFHRLKHCARVLRAPDVCGDWQ